MSNSFYRYLLTIGILLFSFAGLAQDSTKNQKQIWPELELYYKINSRFRIYSQISGTRLNSSYTDGALGAYLDYFSFPWRKMRMDKQLNDTSRGYYLWFRMGYSYSNTTPGEGANKEEQIILTQADTRYYLPAEFMLTVRNRFDWRFINSSFQPRYRPRLRFDRNLKSEFMTLDAYAYGEYYFYLNDNSQNRFRICFGVEIRVLRFMNFETYYLYQFPNSPKVASLTAIGLGLNFYLRSKHAKG
jgi:Protein of unknown function (DUF2490)